MREESTSRKIKSAGGSELLQTYENRFILFVMSVGVVSGGFLAALAFFSENPLDIWVYFVISLAVALGVCSQLIFGLNPGIRVFYTACLLAIFFYQSTVGREGETGLFICLAVTPAIVALSGFRMGAILLTTVFLVLAAFFRFDLYLFPDLAFSSLTEIRFLINFVWLSLFAIGLDYSRSRIQSTLITLNRSMNEIAQRDQLTGLANRREMDEKLQLQWQNFQSAAKIFSVLLCNIDDFKGFNDRYGHDFGDRIIAVIGQRLQNALRGNDLVARWGGDEFLILLPGQTSRSAVLIGERLRKRVAETALEHGGFEVRVTLSAGVACVDSVSDLNELLKQADAGLYQAKNMGKDRLVNARG